MEIKHKDRLQDFFTKDFLRPHFKIYLKLFFPYQVKPSSRFLLNCVCDLVGVFAVDPVVQNCSTESCSKIFQKIYMKTSVVELAMSKVVDRTSIFSEQFRTIVFVVGNIEQISYTLISTLMFLPTCNRLILVRSYEWTYPQFQFDEVNQKFRIIF